MSKQNDDIRVQLAALFEEHDYNKRYERLSVVYYMVDGKIEFYQAIKDVPRFTPISDTRVWNKSSNAILTSSEEPTFDNDFIPMYLPPEASDQIPTYYLELVDDNVLVTIVAYYVIPNQTTQPEITGIKINNVSYTLVSLEDCEPAPGLAVTQCNFIPIDEEMYEEMQEMKQMGVDIDANIGDGLFMVMINAVSDTALSGPITFELNTDVGNCTIIVPEYVEPKQSYIYVTRDDTYNIGFSDGYYSYDYDNTQAWASYLESDIGNTTTITVSGTYVACTGWQESSDGETWTDIPNSASNELEVTVPEESHYYKPIVVSTEPNWVEISRTVNNTTCNRDYDGFNTGICNTQYKITYEDQNPNSITYEDTYSTFYNTEEEDLVSCPIPQTVDTPIYINAFTEHTENGTTTTNDSSAAYITEVIYFRWNSDESQSGNYSATVPYTGNIKLKTGDKIGISFKITIGQGYSLTSLYYRESNNGSWTSVQPILTAQGWISFDTSSTYFELRVVVTQEQQSSGTTPVYQKVTSAPANGDWSGEYLIVNSDLKIFNGSLAKEAIGLSNNCRSDFVSYFSNDSLPANIGQTNVDIYNVSVTGTANNYIIQANSGCYLYGANSNKLIGVDSTSELPSTINITFNTSDSSVNIVCHNNNENSDYYLTCSSSKFTFWKTGSVPSSYKNAYLYKRVLI